MELKKPRGIVAPVFTPFKANGDLNLELIEDYLAMITRHNYLDGILVNGTSGEGMSMNTAERKAAAEEWISAARAQKLTVMIQVGGTSLPDVLELAKHAESIGADSILCLPELYTRPTSIKELVAYLRLVSAAAPHSPLLYYHIPMFTNVTIHMGQFLRHVCAQPQCIPTLVGIKFTSCDLDEGYEAFKTGLSVFLGADTLMLSAAHLGFDSVIATTLNFCRTDIMNPKAANTQRQGEQLELIDLVKVITKYGGWVPSMKIAMKHLGMDCGPVRSPMTSITEAQEHSMLQDLKKLPMKHLKCHTFI